MLLFLNHVHFLAEITDDIVPLSNLTRPTVSCAVNVMHAQVRSRAAIVDTTLKNVKSRSQQIARRKLLVLFIWDDLSLKSCGMSPNAS